jgi:hypothetical protein
MGGYCWKTIIGINTKWQKIVCIIINIANLGLTIKIVYYFLLH